MLKTFYEIENNGQFHNTFFSIIYTSIGVLPYVLARVMSLERKFTQKSFMKLAPTANFIKNHCNLLLVQVLAHVVTLGAYTAL